MNIPPGMENMFSAMGGMTSQIINQVKQAQTTLVWSTKEFHTFADLTAFLNQESAIANLQMAIHNNKICIVYSKAK